MCYDMYRETLSLSLSLSNPLSLSLVSFSPSLSLVSSLSPLPLSLFTTQTQVILFQTNFSIFQYFKMQDTREQPGSNPGAPEFPEFDFSSKQYNS